MAHTDLPALEFFVALFDDNPTLHQLGDQLIGDSYANCTLKETMQRYQKAIQLIGDELWGERSDYLNETYLQKYQQLYRELEQLISLKNCANRKYRPSFIITIPVADRPQHLQSCLDSLLTLCHTFHYGGQIDGRFNKVKVIIADDSKEISNISKNRDIAQHFCGEGLEVIYFGQDEQLQQLDQLPASEKVALKPILGNIDRSRFYHKGASIMRNITYLKLRKLIDSEVPTLFYFIDSDQEFKVKVNTPEGDRDIYAISFLHDLEQIFTQQPIEILTGKVVGDPPVSPSVMAGNFLEDVISFLHRISTQKPNVSCQFHNMQKPRTDDASYHDMADLFGFKTTSQSFQYSCPLTAQHDHFACFSDFADKLNRFFDGEHPTRKTYYEHQQLNTTIAAARTIYTGNYIFRASALDYFIPFATLKLRMAGPVLGRIIKAELGDQFVSANLPMLHKRTVHETGQSEFRPGVNREQRQIDLSGEFERQFFGDVMLFTMELLTAEGYPHQTIPADDIRAHVEQIEANMHHKYLTKQNQIIKNIALFRTIFSDPQQWWNSADNSTLTIEAKLNFKTFIDNIEHNFGDDAAAYKLIGSAANREKRLNEIVDAISQYSQDRIHWKSTLTD
ncbi:MAG: hypothetical protein OQK25_06470 [Gammaproteobacteria bacterium]|nr:hypothetical protein [Gammaproteobacteria bacterium]